MEEERNMLSAVKLDRAFFARPTLEVAPDLLGKYLVYCSPHGKLVGEITEVEAYIGANDPASHAFRGRTPRTEVMFGEPGLSYVYFIYGMYYCLNIVTEAKDQPAAVLIRSVIPVEGFADMSPKLTDGPGKLCRAFGITLAQNKIDVTTSDILYVEDQGKKPKKIHKSTRIGIKKATELLWRFYY